MRGIYRMYGREGRQFIYHPSSEYFSEFYTVWVREPGVAMRNGWAMGA